MTFICANDATHKEPPDVKITSYTGTKGVCRFPEGTDLETLSVGRHTLAIVSDTGTTSTEFVIKAAVVTDEGTDTSQTGDNSDMEMWFALLFIAACVTSGTILYNRRKDHGK